jgi:hypothetical protein
MFHNPTGFDGRVGFDSERSARLVDMLLMKDVNRQTARLVAPMRRTCCLWSPTSPWRSAADGRQARRQKRAGGLMRVKRWGNACPGATGLIAVNDDTPPAQ